MKGILSAALAASALFAAAPATAVVLNPGDTDKLFTPFSTVVGTQGSLLASLAAPGVPALTFNATMRTAVYRNTLGTLDFYYQVARNGPGTVSDTEIRGFTASDFGNFSVEAFVSATDPDGAGFFTAVNNGTSGSTTEVGRSSGPGGVLITDFFGFDTTGNGLVGTENSATYIFRTNATTFGTGTFGISNGSAQGGTAFQPIGIAAVIPEPGTWFMMIAGFGLVGGALRGARRPAKPVVA